jgi:hypothetical protein
VRILRENASEVLERFYLFQDGVVSAVSLQLRAEPRRCEVVVQAQDRDSASGWSTVRFVVQSVSECRFQLGNSTFEVLSGGIQLGWVGDSICVVFDAYPDDGPQLPVLKTNTAYVMGHTCDIEISPLP